MKVVAIIQARLTSVRFPEKVLQKIVQELALDDVKVAQKSKKKKKPKKYKKRKKTYKNS